MSGSQSDDDNNASTGARTPTTQELVKWALAGNMDALEQFNDTETVQQQEGYYLRSPEDSLRAIATAVWLGLIDVIGETELTTIFAHNRLIQGTLELNQDPKYLYDAAKAHFRVQNEQVNEAIAARLRKAQGEYKPGKIHELIGVVERNERIMN